MHPRLAELVAYAELQRAVLFVGQHEAWHAGQPQDIARQLATQAEPR